MSSLVSIVSNTSFQLLGKAFTSIGTLLVLSLVARTYGSYGSGIFTLSVLYLAPFTLLVDFGLNALAVRVYTESLEIKMFPALLIGRAIVSVLAAFVAFFLALGLTKIPSLAAGFPSDFFWCVLALLPSLVGYGLYLSTVSIFQWKLKFGYVASVLFLGTLTTAILAFIFGLSHLPIVFIAASYSAGSIVMALAALFFVRFLARITFTPNLHLLWPMVKEALPFALTLIFNTLYFRLDSFLLSVLHGISITGQYNLAYTVFANILVVPTFIMNSVYPLFLRKQQTRVRHKTFVLQTALTMALVGVGVSLVGYLLSPLFLWFWLGKNVSFITIDSLRLLLLSTPIFFGTSFAMWLVISAKKLWWLPGIYLSGMVISALGNSLFVPTYGYKAAAIMTFAGELSVLIMFSVLMYKHRQELFFG